MCADNRCRYCNCSHYRTSVIKRRIITTGLSPADHVLGINNKPTLNCILHRTIPTHHCPVLLVWRFKLHNCSFTVWMRRKTLFSLRDYAKVPNFFLYNSHLLDKPTMPLLHIVKSLTEDVFSKACKYIWPCVQGRMPRCTPTSVDLLISHCRSTDQQGDAVDLLINLCRSGDQPL